MENLKEQKSEKSLKGWLVGGIIAGLLYIAASVLFFVNFSATAAGSYDFASMLISTLGAYADTFGLVAISGFIFLLGLLLKKGSAQFFVKFMLWTILLLTLYYIMPKFVYFYNIIVYGSTIDASQTLYILSSILPHIIFAAFLVAYLYQLGSPDRKGVYVLSWISLLAAIITFANQVIFVIQRTVGGDPALNIYYYAMAALGLFMVIFLSAVFHRASQKKKGEFYGV